MGWGSVMTAVCYDVLNQAVFDKTVLSTSVFIVSPVSPSTTAGWWNVSVLVQRGVWGFALEWPAHPSGPRTEAVLGYRITGRMAADLSLWNAGPATSSQHPIYPALSIKPGRVDVGGNRLTEFRGSGCQTERLFHAADLYEWGRGSCLSEVGGCSLFKPADPVVGWHVWLFPAVNQVRSQRDGLQEFPLSSAVWMGCHTDWCKWSLNCSCVSDFKGGSRSPSLFSPRG